ncbi:hypothetical protein HGRIS_013715 [Hohenbuehelia grisea]|uniref:F-box domain-containing protein n=1 Tax=Hohenbuehelia grisea TaxID=104357 RepID=A0ABR3IWJ3_9AGAR
MSTRKFSRLPAQVAAVPSTSAVLAEDLADFDEILVDSDDNETPVLDGNSAKRKIEEEIYEEPTTTKKPRIQRKGRGKLRDLPHMPLDILFDIFSNLNPSDLLRLARTTKALRDILMRRSASPIWRAACANISGLPDCPPDMAIPAFVNLLFDTHCHACEHQGASHMIWVYRKRFCKKCLYNRSVRVVCLQYSHPDLVEHPLWPRLEEIIPIFPLRTGRNRFPHCLPAYVQTVFDAYTACSEGEKEQFINTQLTLVKERPEFATLCTRWMNSARQERSSELEELRKQRRTAIMGKLGELGFGSELDDLDYNDRNELYGHSLVNQTRKLTDRNECLAKLPPNRVVPTGADLYSLKVDEVEVAKKLLEETSFDVHLTPEHYGDFEEAVPKLIDHWKELATRKLIDILVDVRTAAGEDTTTSDMSIFDLATSSFRCLSCKTFISYPRVLVHSCARRYCHTQEDFENLSIAIAAYGFDPKVATIQDLDKVEKVLACEECSSLSSYCVVGWQAAATHGSHHQTWVTLSAEDAARANVMANGISHEDHSRIACTRCPSFMSLDSIASHFLYRHSEPCDNPVEGVDYNVRLDAKSFESSRFYLPRS